MCRVFKPGAPFLFTATEIEGADEGGITGTMNGVTFHYYAVASYRTLLAAHGMVLVDVHDEPGVSTYYLATKRGRREEDRETGRKAPSRS